MKNNLVDERKKYWYDPTDHAPDLWRDGWRKLLSPFPSRSKINNSRAFIFPSLSEFSLFHCVAPTFVKTSAQKLQTLLSAKCSLAYAEMLLKVIILRWLSSVVKVLRKHLCLTGALMVNRSGLKRCRSIFSSWCRLIRISNSFSWNFKTMKILE